MTNAILDHVKDEILHITLNDPGTGNAISNEMAATLADVLDAAADRARFVVLRAAGDDFCIGRNTMGRKRTTRPEALALRRTNDVVFRCYGAFRRTTVPVISVVQGRALGFGCALAACADMTIASSDATFQLPEFGHNIMPTMAMSALLGKVPQKALMYITYSTATFNAARALQLGLISDLVERGQLEGAVDQLCASLLRAPQPAVLAVKEFARSAPGMNIDHAIEYARALHATVNSSGEMRREEH